MATAVQASKFVPLSRKELHAALAADEPMRRVATLLHHTMRFDADRQVEAVRAAYAPFDPDPDIPGRGGDEEAFLRAFEGVMADANFRRVPREELQEAFDEKSLFPLHADVDLEEYDILRLYKRGTSTRHERYRRMSTMYRWKQRELTVYNRLVVVLRLKAEVLAGDRTTRMEGMEPGKIYIKSFKDIPTADVEMVLPNTRLRLRRLDRILVGGPLVAGVGATIFNSVGIFLAILTGAFALSLDDPQVRALGGILIVIGGYLWKTHSKIKNTRLKYLRTLSAGLYFRNLANNAAVIDQMLRFSLDEEEKEAFIAYALLQHGPVRRASLDEHAEAWLRKESGRVVDFDVRDGLDTLEGLGLAERRWGKWHAMPPGEAAALLDSRWDAAF